MPGNFVNRAHPPVVMLRELEDALVHALVANGWVDCNGVPPVDAQSLRGGCFTTRGPYAADAQAMMHADNLEDMPAYLHGVGCQPNAQSIDEAVRVFIGVASQFAHVTFSSLAQSTVVDGALEFSYLGRSLVAINQQ